jgi:chemosensory pili system protein ChpC
MTSQAEIYSLLVPLARQRLLIPRANVAEVAGYRKPVPYPDAPPWLLGAIDWEGEKVPLVSFEGLIGDGVPAGSGRMRIVLLRTLGDRLPCKTYGVVTQGFPQLVRVNAVVLAPDADADWPADGPVLCQVRMVNQRPLIPDVDCLERLLAAALPARAPG